MGKGWFDIGCLEVGFVLIVTNPLKSKLVKDPEMRHINKQNAVIARKDKIFIRVILTISV